MTIVHFNDLMAHAESEGYAIGYFESWNLESTRSVVNAAEEEQSPLIMGFNGERIAAQGHILEHYVVMGKVQALRIFIILLTSGLILTYQPGGT